MALPRGLVNELVLKQEATSETTFSAFELYSVFGGEPVKNFKQRSFRIQCGTVGNGKVVKLEARNLIAGVSPGERG